MKAGIYARISKDTEGTELGVTRQQEDCRAEAARRGWDVEDVFVDNDVSATRSKIRPEYQRMITAVQARRIDAIIVWDVDRLTRTPRELEDVIDLADRYGLKLANVGGDIDLSTPQGRMTARIKGTVARHDTDQQSRRLRRKFLEKAERGEPHGFSPYGFTRIDGRDVVNEEQAPIIREAARRTLSGESLRAIVTDLNIRGIHGPRAEQWNTTILRQTLLRASNAGLREHRGKLMGQSTTEPIYSEDTYNQLVSYLRDPARKTNHAGPGFKYLLSGIAFCGACGGSMRRQQGRNTVSKRTGAAKRQPPSYCCTVCFKVRRAQEPIDALVADVLAQRLALPDAVELFAASDDGAAAAAQARLQAIDAKLDAAADQFADDTITGAQLKRITARLRDERGVVERQLRAAHPSPAVADLTGGDVAAKWAALPLAVQREVVETLMTITIKPSGSGRRFDPEDIVIAWRS